MKETTIASITPELDALAAEAMAEWKVPGLAARSSTMTSALPLAIGTGCRTCFSTSIELGAWSHLTIAVSWAWTV
jgi:hypothetical protein